MEKEKFENGIRLKVSYREVKVEAVALFNDLVLDLSDMMPTGNIEGAIKAEDKLVPKEYLKILQINKNNVHMVINTKPKDIKVLTLGDTVIFNDNIFVELLAIRFNADVFDDWQTKKTS